MKKFFTIIFVLQCLISPLYALDIQDAKEHAKSFLRGAVPVSAAMIAGYWLGGKAGHERIGVAAGAVAGALADHYLLGGKDDKHPYARKAGYVAPVFIGGIVCYMKMPKIQKIVQQEVMPKVLFGEYVDCVTEEQWNRLKDASLKALRAQFDRLQQDNSAWPAIQNDYDKVSAQPNEENARNLVRFVASYVTEHRQSMPPQITVNVNNEQFHFGGGIACMIDDQIRMNRYQSARI